MATGDEKETWVGQRSEIEDDVTAASVAGLSTTLDRDDPWPSDGDALPPLWHWMYFAPRARMAVLGPDGHPRRGGFIPPINLPHRMFAGGRLDFHAPLRVGQRVRRIGEVTAVAHKTGRSGPLVFVTVQFRIFAGETLLIEEENDIVYRDSSAGHAASTPIAADLNGLQWRRTVTPDPVLLFRYSALTFNSHRIHYDQPYVTEVEGYPGLIVHGPLIATLLAELYRDHAGGRPMKGFEFRAHRPLFVPAPFTVAGGFELADGAARLLAADQTGAVAMTAKVYFEQSTNP